MELTIKETAVLLGKSPRTVRHMARTGKLPARQVERVWRVDRAALVETWEAETEARREILERLRDRIEATVQRATPAAPGGPASTRQDGRFPRAV